MPIVEEYIDFVTNPRVAGMYNKMGYETIKKDGKDITVRVKSTDIFPNSQVIIRAECDYCHRIVEIKKNLYTASITKTYHNKFACKSCYGDKIRDTWDEKYGCTPFLLPEVKEKAMRTSLKRYGTIYPMQNEQVKEHLYNSFEKKYGTKHPACLDSFKEKVRQTNRERYGVDYASQLPATQEKKRQTVRAKYGVDYVVQLDECKAKAKQTMRERYGVDHVMQLPEFRQKANETFFANGTGRSSTQQRHICQLVNGKLNYPQSGYKFDIVIDNIDIEYNGSGHNLCVATGQKTQEQFDEAETRRKQKAIEAGYKIMNLDSKTDKLPSDNIIIYIVQALKFYLDNFDDDEISFNFDTFEITTST